ncbi:MAG: ChbG/HpnK family deacetylase [Planctomycetes bacterium]|nr:ChbG/HpnK family deacetylase [Planctomycetota bacterium]
MKFVIFNADDFGLSDGVNRGIVECHRQGVVTSASLMVRGAAAGAAAGYARSHPRLSLGLHIDLGEWALRNGEWEPVYQVVDVAEETAVREEIERQLHEFERLTGRPPTHVDSHQHVHLREPARSLVVTLGERLGVPVRHFCDRIRYNGDFYGQDAEGRPLPAHISPAALVRTIRKLPEGITECCCHPGYAQDLPTMYATEREVEVQTLCDRRIRDCLEAAGVRLISFAEVDP